MREVPTRGRVDRLDLLARLLRDQPGISAGAAATVLGVSARSVFRDVAALRERGYPIEGGRGRGGGLRIHAHWGLGRILLSSEEALCLLLSLAITEALGLPMFAQDAGRARRKVVDAFPAAERRRIGPLRERVFVGSPASAAVRASYGEPLGGAVRPLQAAFVAAREIVARYRREGGDARERRIEPHAIVINFPAWYLLGWDVDRQAPRTFRFDRFEAVTVGAREFRPRPRDVAAELLANDRVALSAL